MVKELNTLEEFLDQGYNLENCSILGLDFSSLSIHWDRCKMKKTYFLGCMLSAEDEVKIIQNGGDIFDEDPDLPYRPIRSNLYSVEELNEILLISGKTRDEVIYNHFYQSRYDTNIIEALWQRIHDHSIDNALRNLIGVDSEGDMSKSIVAIMGGHGTLRTDENYRNVALLTYKLTKAGYYIATGGGPGIMEAANLGAYMAGYSSSEVLQAISMMEAAPYYRDADYQNLASQVREKFPVGAESLAIPTWFYGHEPSNLFSTYIAKYFSNSIREDNLLGIALHGVVYAPGSAGTFQEIFMDFAQNFYKTFKYVSPMVFLNSAFYKYDTFLYPVLEKLSQNNDVKEAIFVSDDLDEIVQFIQEHPPK